MYEAEVFTITYVDSTKTVLTLNASLISRHYSAIEYYGS